MKKTLIQLSLITVLTATNLLANENINSIIIKGVSQNPEGIEYNQKDKTFFLSSLNAMPIIKVKSDGSYVPFTSGEAFPLSTAGLQIDEKNNRLLVAGFNGTEIMDNNPKTKGVSFLKIYNLSTGVLEREVNLSSLIPDASAYFANDIAVDDAGNAYISDWYAKVIYKVDLKGKATLFWRNNTNIPSGINGLDFHKDGYILASLLSVNDKGIYAQYGLVKIPVNDTQSAQIVELKDKAFRGFDGMVITKDGTVVGVSNNGKTPGGNTLIELHTKDQWKSAQVMQKKDISPSTTVAITEENHSYVIHQDFSDNMKKVWTIEKVGF